jgi:hypothetical protein
MCASPMRVQSFVSMELWPTNDQKGSRGFAARSLEGPGDGETRPSWATVDKSRAMPRGSRSKEGPLTPPVWDSRLLDEFPG